MIIYTGVFFKQEFKGKLEKKIEFPHITHQFKPSTIDYSLFGQEVEFEIIGYGNDLNNEGYLVRLVNGSNEMKKAFEEVKIPHITISVSADGKPVNTVNLKFRPYTVPVRIKGIYGGFNGKGIE